MKHRQLELRPIFGIQPVPMNENYVKKEEEEDKSQAVEHQLVYLKAMLRGMLKIWRRRRRTKKIHFNLKQEWLHC